MGRTSVKSLLCTAIVVGTVMVLTAACGGGGNDDGGEPTKAPAATTAPSSTKPASDGAASGSVDLVAKNTLWDKTELTAKAGTVTFNVDNQDAGIVHNLHVYKGEDAKGEDLGMTELEAGPGKQTLVLELTAGEYFLVCDAHPATMAAKLEVE